MAVQFRTRPDGTVYPLTGGKGGKAKGAGLVAAAAIVFAGGGTLGLGELGASAGEGATSIAGDVVDSLPGRDLKTRKAEGRKSAERGRTNEAWSRVKFKELKRKVGTGLECVASSTGRVREFLIRTPCTALDGMLLLVGDGRGSTAVVSVVRIRFRTTTQADAFQKVENVGGSGDVRPLDVSTALNLANVKITGLHYHPRRDKAARIIAEADTATGHLDDEILDALAYIASYLPIRSA